MRCAELRSNQNTRLAQTLERCLVVIAIAAAHDDAT